MKKLVTKKVTQYEYDKEGRVTKITESSEEYKVEVEDVKGKVFKEGAISDYKLAVGIPLTEDKYLAKTAKDVAVLPGSMVKKTDINSAKTSSIGTVTSSMSPDFIDEVRQALDQINRTSAF